MPASSTPPSNSSSAANAVALASTQPPPLTRRIRLVKQHIHAGLPKRPGEEIELLHDLADWLVAEGAAQEIEPAPVPTSITTSTTTPPAINPIREK